MALRRVFLVSLWTTLLVFCPKASLANLVLQVQPVAVYDSRYNGTDNPDGTPDYAAVGTYSYLPGVNGAYAATFEDYGDPISTIFNQCNGMSVHFRNTKAFDSATYLNVSATEQDDLFDGNDATVENWIAAKLPPNHHHVFFVNTHANTPVWTSATVNTEMQPLGGGWGTLSSPPSFSVEVAGVAVAPAVGATANMRSVMAQSDDLDTAAEENMWKNSTVPTVLAHEISHNLSLQHVTGAADTSNLMYTGTEPDGTQSVLTPAQCQELRVTGVANGTIVPEPSAFLFGGVLAGIAGMIRVLTRFTAKSRPK